MSHRILTFREIIPCATLLLASAARAQHAFEPDPEFAERTANYAQLLSPGQGILFEAESFRGPAGWAARASDFLNLPCSGTGVMMMSGAGNADQEVTLAAAGKYRLWVRSHGAPGRSFKVWINGKPTEGTYGDAAMSWRTGGEFDLPAGKVTIRIGDAQGNPYCDCLLLGLDPRVEPAKLVPLRAWTGDERWMVAGRGGTFNAAASNGLIDEWAWDFGDGSVEKRKAAAISHAYARAGDYQLKLTVKDASGREASRSAAVHVWADGKSTTAEIPAARLGGTRFGDLDGDGSIDFLTSSPFQWADAVTHAGKKLWSWNAPADFKQPAEIREHPMVIWDFDGDAKPDVAMWRLIDGKEWLCLCDGVTGTVKKKVAWPAERGYVNGRLAVGFVTGDPKRATILMLNGQAEAPYHQQVDAYDADLKQLFSFGREGADTLGHYVYSRDIDGDGKEETFVSGMMIRPDGTRGWLREEFQKAPTHADSIRIEDIDADGKFECVTVCSDAGVHVLDAATGKTLWSHPTNHAQQLEVADIRPDIPGLEVIVGDRFYLPELRARLLLYDCRGNLLEAFPGRALTGNPNLGVLQWDGKPGMEIAWSNLVLDGQARVLSVLPDTLLHTLDFNNDGLDEVIGSPHNSAPASLKVFSYPATLATKPTTPNDPMRLRRIANHSHY